MNLPISEKIPQKIEPGLVVAKKIPTSLASGSDTNPSISQKSAVVVNEKIVDGKAKTALAFVGEPTTGQKIGAATQTALKASSANGIGTSLGLTLGGGTIGYVAAKTLGRKAMPLVLAGLSVGSLVDRTIGIAKNTEKIKESYTTGKTDATKLETVLNGVGFALDLASVSSLKLLIKESGKVASASAKMISHSEVPLSEGFRQYKTLENLVGKSAGEAWEHSITKGIPVPVELAKVKGTAKVTGADAFADISKNLKMEGSTIPEIVSKVPKEAQLRELTPSPTIKEGFEYAWVDKKSNMDYRLRIHGPDSGVALKNPGSTAAQGWIARVERNPVGKRIFPETEYLTLDGKFHPSRELMALEKQKKDADLALAVLRDIQATSGISVAKTSAVGGEISLARGVAAIGQEKITLAKSIRLAGEIEHFHHNTHIAVGGGLNKAIK